MNIDTAFPSKYLKAADCEAGDITLTIQDVRIEEIGPENDSKPVVFFKERDQGWVLNKTNKNILVDAFGLQTDNWIGNPTCFDRPCTSTGSDGETVTAATLIPCI